MAVYQFETITAAQALAITAADTVTTSGQIEYMDVYYRPADATNPERVEVVIGNRSVVFGTAVEALSAAGRFASGRIYIGTPGSDGPATLSSTDDVIFGGAGGDNLSGGGGFDRIEAGAGDDVLSGGTGRNTIDGGEGLDIIVFDGNRSDFEIGGTGNGRMAVWRNGVSDDTLRNVEVLRFRDGDYSAVNAIWIDVIADSFGREGASGDTARSFQVLRSGDLSGSASVDWRVGPAGFGSVVNGGDFQGGVLPSGQITFAPGEASKLITFYVTGDTTPEGDENYTVTLSNVTGGATLTQASQTGSIPNDDASAPTFSIAYAQYAVTEPDAGSITQHFVVTRVGGSSEAASVNYAVTTAGGTYSADAADFVGGVLPTGRVDFAAGENSKDIYIQIAGDKTVETDERYSVAISPVTTAQVSPVISTASADGLITTNDYPPGMYFAGSSTYRFQSEGNSGATPFVVRIERMGVLDAATVDWRVAAATSGTAASSSDFASGQFPSGQLSFAEGESFKEIVLNIVGDTAYEAHETFTVTLSNASNGAALNSPTLTVGIDNDDPPATIAVTPLVASQAEGDSGATAHTFIFTRTGDLSYTSSFDWMANGNAPQLWADAGDFESHVVPSGRVEFAPGETQKTITVYILGDTNYEPDESVRIEFSNPSAGTWFDMFGTRQTAGTASSRILNDDPKPEGEDDEDFVPSMTDLAGDDTVLGGPGADSISGERGGNNYLRGGEGDDYIVGGADFDDINGNQGEDIAEGGPGDDWVVGGKDDDWLAGDGGDDIVYGNLGSDICEGGDGRDLVRGGQQDDLLSGGADDDWLSGDRGDDTIVGESGADIFHSFADAGIDRVLDFSRAEGDRVQLDPGTVYAVSQIGADTVVQMQGGGQLVLVGVAQSSLTGEWIFGA